MERVQIRHNSGPKFYPVFETRTALAWLGQVSALELHVPQWRIAVPSGPQISATSTERHPDRVVFDLDPGPSAGLAECVEVAQLLRERLGPLGDRVVPVTSGSKALHLYVPMDDPITSEQATAWARLAAEQLENALPELVVSKMTKSLRAGKVLVDWSQNNAEKTTIAPYSLRGRDSPTVAAPRSWAELSEPGLRHLDYREVLERVADGVDPLAALTTEPVQTLAAAVGIPVRRPPGRPGARVEVHRSTRPTGQSLGDIAATRRKLQRFVADTALLPTGSAGPVDVALAKAEDTIPGPHALRVGSTFELKHDGYRMAIVAGAGGVRLWSRSRSDLTDRCPETGLAPVYERALVRWRVVPGDQHVAERVSDGGDDEPPMPAN